MQKAQSGILKFITSIEFEPNERYLREIRLRFDATIFLRLFY